MADIEKILNDIEALPDDAKIQVNPDVVWGSWKVSATYDSDLPVADLKALAVELRRYQWMIDAVDGLEFEQGSVELRRRYDRGGV